MSACSVGATPQIALPSDATAKPGEDYSRAIRSLLSLAWAYTAVEAMLRCNSARFTTRRSPVRE